MPCLGSPLRRRHVVALPLVLLSACEAVPAPPSASLPPDAVQGAGDPARAAIITTANLFAAPGSVAGRPVLAARAAVVTNQIQAAVEELEARRR